MKILGHILACVAVCCYAALVHAAGITNYSVQPVAIDEGDAPIPFAVTCSSTAWTVLVASDTIRRSVLAQTSFGVGTAVCISTGPAGDPRTCVDSTPGIELSSSTWNDSSKSQWFCRSRAALLGPLGILKGYVSRDKRDYGYIPK